MASKFLQIHTLTPFAATLLNRDDAGFAKRMPFGGVTRTRVSSQCLKHHWRKFDGERGLNEIDAADTIRSRRTFEHYVVRPLMDSGLAEAKVRAVTEAVMTELIGKSAKAEEKDKEKADKKKDSAALHTSQITVLGRPEINFIKDLVASLVATVGADEKKLAKEAADQVKAALDKDAKTNLKQLSLASGLSAALFGRMVTSDILARSDAAIHVAHAFTVHEQDTEDDYFSALDDLMQESGEQGSGHINSAELTSGLFYGYVVVDVPLLVSNLTGCGRKEWQAADRTMAGDIVERLVEIICSVSPGAKLGSTAPYSRANLVMVESGSAQPRTLANAFFEPIAARGDVTRATYEKLAGHLSEMDQMYSWSGARCFAAMGPKEKLDWAATAKASVNQVAAWAKSEIVGKES